MLYILLSWRTVQWRIASWSSKKLDCRRKDYVTKGVATIIKITYPINIREVVEYTLGHLTKEKPTKDGVF